MAFRLSLLVLVLAAPLASPLQRTAQRVLAPAAPQPELGKGTKTCLMSDDKLMPTQEPLLKTCTEYKASSCCSVQEDTKVMEDIDQVWKSVLGACPGCLENMRRMLCGIRCAPDITKKLQMQKANAAGRATQSVYRMCPQFCHSWFTSCVNTTLAAKYNNNENPFCEAVVRHLLCVVCLCVLVGAVRLVLWVGTNGMSEDEVEGRGVADGSPCGIVGCAERGGPGRVGGTKANSGPSCSLSFPPYTVDAQQSCCATSALAVV